MHRAREAQPIYVYYFVHWPAEPASPCSYGCRAGHGAEIPFAFDQLGQDKRAWRDSDRRLSDEMAAYWTNFAKYGDPNGHTTPKWIRFDDNNASVSRLGDQQEVQTRGTLPNFTMFQRGTDK